MSKNKNTLDDLDELIDKMEADCDSSGKTITLDLCKFHKSMKTAEKALKERKKNEIKRRVQNGRKNQK